MAWQTPKTNWKAQYDVTGLFIGDFFNVTDYNRIKNNLLHLREMAARLMGNVPVITVGADKHYPSSHNMENDYFYADEINLIEDGLAALDARLPFVDFGSKKTYYPNGAFIDYTELNRIERAELNLYNILTDSIAGQRRLAFKLGKRMEV